MLTKTDFKNYIKCAAFLWLSKHEPNLLPDEDPEMERMAKMGREVDELAKKLFVGGFEVKGFNEDGWKNTQKAMEEGKEILFQPTAVADPLTCRADILIRGKDGKSWDINEVKMATSARKEDIVDVGFQKICFEEAGIKIGKTSLIYINTDYVRHGEIEIKKLFTIEDVTEQVNEKIPEIKEEIKKALEIMNIEDRLDIRVIEGCKNPKKCEYLECYCKEVPEIYGMAGKIPEKHLLALVNREILDPKKLDKEILKAIEYKPLEKFTEINKEAIRKEFSKLEYPLYFFDYETYMSAIPPFDGTKPYQQIPFQYSLTIKETPKAKPKSLEFLARKFENPIPDLLAQLKKDMGPKGSVIVWYSSFEKGRNEEMGEMYPEYANFLKGVNKRVFDLYQIFRFRNKMYIKSDFQELASLKIILPVLCPELSYENLAIREGGEASASWPILTSDKTTAEEKERLEKNMLAYCKRDTEAMVGIMERVNKDIK